MLKGDLVNWNDAKFDLVNMTEEVVTEKSICIPPRPGHVIYPEKRRFPLHHALCTKLKGRTSVIRDSATQLWMNEKIEQTPSCLDANGKIELLLLHWLQNILYNVLYSWKHQILEWLVGCSQWRCLVRCEHWRSLAAAGLRSLVSWRAKWKHIGELWHCLGKQKCLEWLSLQRKREILWVLWTRKGTWSSN